jgi:hypothetical protein
MANYVARDTQSSAGATQLSFTFPSATANGHRAILILASQNRGAPGQFANPNTASVGFSGWSKVGQGSSGSGTYSVYERTCNGSEAGSTQQANTTTSAEICGHLLIYNGLTGAGVMGADFGGTGQSFTYTSVPSGGTTGTTAFTAQSITSPGSNKMFLAIATPDMENPGGTYSGYSMPSSFTCSGFADRGYVNNDNQYGQQVFELVRGSVFTSQGASMVSNVASIGGAYIAYWPHDGVLPDVTVNVTGVSGTMQLMGGPDTPGLSYVIGSSPHPTGVVGTLQLGAFTVQAGSVIGVLGVSATGVVNTPAVRLPDLSFTPTGVSGTAALGAAYTEALYNGATVLTPTTADQVRILAPAPRAMRGYVPQRINAGYPPDYTAFQISAFQDTTLAFQEIANNFPAGVQATGVVGSVIYKASYACTGVVGTGTLGSVAVHYDTIFSMTGVFGTGFIGTGFTILTGQAISVTGLVGTTHLGTVGLRADMIFTLPKGIYYLQPMRGQVGIPGVNRSSAAAITGVFGTMTLGAFDPAVRYTVTGVAGSGALGTVGTAVGYAVSLAAAQGQVGVVVGGWVQTPPVSGVSGTGAVGTPTPYVPAIFRNDNLSVAGSGGVGQVAFQISSSPPVSGVVGSGRLGAVGIRVDAPVGVTGVVGHGGARKRHGNQHAARSKPWARAGSAR